MSASVAQLVEHSHGKAGVIGSSPIGGCSDGFGRSCKGIRGFGYGADGEVRGKAPIPPVDEVGLIKPWRIEPGDRIAVVSPSWGGGGLFPGLLDLGIAGLQRTPDVEVVEFPTARADADYLYEYPEERARDINDAFGEPSIRGIIAVIGGSESIRILEDLHTG